MSRMNALLKRAACTNLVSQLPRTSTLSMRTMHTSRAVAAGGSHHTSQSGFHGEHHDDHAHEPHGHPLWHYPLNKNVALFWTLFLVVGGTLTFMSNIWIVQKRAGFWGKKKEE